MRKTKEYKTKILAALALALALGMMVPGAVFASEDNADAGIMLTAESDGASTRADTKKLGLVESVAELANRIETRSQFANYRKNRELVSNAVVMDGFLNAKKTLDEDAEFKLSDGSSIWSKLSTTTRNNIGNKNAQDAVTIIKGASEYTNGSADFKNKVNAVEASFSSTLDSLKNQITTNLSGQTTTGKTPKELVDIVKAIPNYSKYAAVATASVFLKDVQPDKTDGLVDRIKALNLSSNAMMINYNHLAVAALAIDSTVMEGLADWKLPDTGKGETPSTPDTGIVGLLESGALDLGTITLIVSVVLASVAGLGLIAKLYFKHKF